MKSGLMKIASKSNPVGPNILLRRSGFFLIPTKRAMDFQSVYHSPSFPKYYGNDIDVYTSFSEIIVFCQKKIKFITVAYHDDQKPIFMNTDAICTIHPVDEGSYQSAGALITLSNNITYIVKESIDEVFAKMGVYKPTE